MKRAWIILLAAVVLAGCGSSGRSPYASDDRVERHPELARELYARAVETGRSDPAEAERLLRRALAADLYHGPAHNNLGVLLLGRGELYEAASEFEWARKLMPGYPAPRVNLALTLERAGKTDEALDAYDAALAVYEGHLPAMQGKARLQIESRRADSETAALLDEIALRGDAEWREWAQIWKVKLAQPEAPIPTR